MITVGIDEVGRGCWAGPLVAAAVVLPGSIAGLTDSKQLSAKQRAALAVIIQEQAVIGLGWVWPATIDAAGITAAVKQAMTEAFMQITLQYDQVIIDGNYNFLSDLPVEIQPKIKTLVKADKLVSAVSAASIIAKVARDHYMAEAAQQYPGYGFERHVGYGTAQHRTALKQLGVCDLHRRSFRPIKALLQ